MTMSVPMILTLGLSGQPFSGADVGGFLFNPDANLFGRWMALGAFYPFSRGHACAGTINKEPWAFGQKVEDVSRMALERRYVLLPYYYTLLHETSETGMPIMRPVFLQILRILYFVQKNRHFLLEKIYWLSQNGLRIQLYLKVFGETCL